MTKNATIDSYKEYLLKLGEIDPEGNQLPTSEDLNHK